MKCFFFVAEFERAAKIRRDHRLRFLNISHSSKVITVSRRVVSEQEVAKEAVKINKICDVKCWTC